MGRLVAIAGFVGNPAEAPAIRHLDRKRLARARHARREERGGANDLAQVGEERFLGRAVEIVRVVGQAWGKGDGGHSVRFRHGRQTIFTDGGRGHAYKAFARFPRKIPKVTFEYSHHARAMLTERVIEREWVERTILAPQATEPDPRHPDRVRAFRPVAERDGRVLRVVYVPAGQTYRVITLFFDRGRRR